MKTDYYKKFENELENIKSSGKRPKILIHACCAPCSSYVSELLSGYFDITLYFYNPNIFPESEHDRRENELKEFLKEFDPQGKIKLITEKYSPMDFARCTLEHETDTEGGERCFRCYDLRLSKTAEKAKELNFDYFATTLTISPHKNAQKINESGEHLSGIYEVKYLRSDFKKRNGFKRSLELSKEYCLYRQDYCGCEFSMERKNSE
ncbi:MAG: epoxyqueuosine reductase QueH [Candidatus Delongbacteria bacterium]